ncbi:YveK family protein [Clostridium sardiniense]|uniref:YveK family protein n=1 Tax=Clostridium sardiniense TaxID=29369 RepID=UPI003D33704B
MKEENINISEILDALKKRYKMIIAVTLAFTIIAVIVSFFVIKPKYEVTTKLFIGKQESKTEKYDSNDVMMYQKLLTTYAEIIKTDDLMTNALKKGNIDEKTKDVEESLKVTPRADTQILEISYTGTNEAEAVKIVKNVTDEFIKESKKLIPNGNIQVIEKAKIPEKPVSPNKKLNIMIAFVLGLMVSIGAALILEFMDNTYKSREEVEKDLNVPVLGVIPELDSEEPSDRRTKHRK